MANLQSKRNCGRRSRHWVKALLVATSCLLASTNVSLAADGGPTVKINNSKGKSAVNIYSPVQISGLAADPDGIREMAAWIKLSNRNRWIGPTGQVTNKRVPVPLSFRQSRQTSWTSQAYKLKPGLYSMTVIAVDGRGNQSANTVHNFVVLEGEKPAIAQNSAAPAATTATAAQLPLVAIKEPKNGSQIRGVAAFNGLARHRAGIAAVNGIVRDKSTGLFLGPDGKFHRNAQLKMRVGKGAKPKWVAPRMQLPAGQYVFAVQSIAPDGSKSKWSESNFTVVAANNQPQVINATGQQPAQPAQQNNARPAAAQMAANGMPYCGANNDPDGDGFGWQNNQSCVVKGSRADTHPNCASSASDPDGDGYGWENERSCIVVSHCASAASDPDGDGFGWENNRSCIVLPNQAQGRFPACTSSGSDPDGDGYGWENNKTCLVAR